MRVLVLGSGGREHALVWSIARSELVDEIVVAPGNPGTATEPKTRNVQLDICDANAVVQLVAEHGIDLVVVGPEAPLVAGVSDALRENGVLVVGPGKDGAELEGSKAFAKQVMVDAGVPTARYTGASTHADVDAFCDTIDCDAVVVKADGLAGGKGVVVCESVEDARAEAHRMLDEQPFGEASAEIVLEERLYGVETSYIVLAAGEEFVAFPTSQDHKRLLDGDEGPNTGGMGAYSPAPFVSDELRDEIERDVIRPTLRELKKRGIDFRGFLYAGVMLTENGPSVLEFNVRMGDPETQVLLASLDSDVVPALLACARGDMSGVELSANRAAAVVVLAAEGYPSKPQKGAVIDGVDDANALDSVRVFHAGTREEDGALRVNGGRVLGVTAHALTPEEAIRLAYNAVGKITWEGMQHRKDIGYQVG